MSAPHVAAVLLAAGASRRLGSAKQLLRDATGEALLTRLVRDAHSAGCAPVVVVLGAYAHDVRELLRDVLPETSDQSLVCVTNDAWEDGMSTSIRAGLHAIEDDSASAMLLLTCDQPSVDRAHIGTLLAHHAQHNERVVSQYGDVCGIPAIWPRVDWPLLEALEGDRGARSLLQGNEDAVPLADGALDLDTPEDVYRWRRTEPRVD